MGGFLPTVAMSALQLGFDAVQQKHRTDLERKAQEARAQSQIEAVQQTHEIQSRQRQEALRRALAAQRARFGSQGLGLGGSADAVLSGIVADSENAARDAKGLALQKINDINTSTLWAHRKNLLDASEPTYRAAFGLIQKSLRKTPLIAY
jgi:hypothetical protein